MGGRVVHVRDVVHREDYVNGAMFLREPNTYIGRFSYWGAGRYFKKSIWANPYTVAAYGLEEALRLYEEWLVGKPELLAKVPTLAEKTLACWCANANRAPRVLTAEDDLVCHGQILLRLIGEPSDLAIAKAVEAAVYKVSQQWVNNYKRGSKMPPPRFVVGLVRALNLDARQSRRLLRTYMRATPDLEDFVRMWTSL
jgi:hypothetical protein